MNNISVEKVDVWAASMKDKPGSLAEILAELHEAGADLDFILARRLHENNNEAVVFITPLRGDTEIDMATYLGFNVANSVHSVRIEGANRPGIAATITRRLADEGINLRGLSAGVAGTQFIMYIGLDSEADADKALTVLRKP